MDGSSVEYITDRPETFSSVSSEMKYIVDVQGFKASSNTFVFKELSMLALEEDAIPKVFLFAPPFSWKFLDEKDKRQNQWLEDNYHGLPWKSGKIQYSSLKNILRYYLDRAEIYVKGAEKLKWLTPILHDRPLYNVEDLGCPALRELPVGYYSCDHHIKFLNYACAVRNVCAMKKWMLEKKSQSEEVLNLLYDDLDMLTL